LQPQLSCRELEIASPTGACAGHHEGRRQVSMRSSQVATTSPISTDLESDDILILKKFSKAHGDFLRWLSTFIDKGRPYQIRSLLGDHALKL
jgi:hypothetical protein